jgi:ligand-binding SRPBCC domain-containing protein
MLMNSYKKQIFINAPIEKVFDFHMDTNNLLRITPRDINFKIISMNDISGVGYKVVLEIRKFYFIRSILEVEITDCIKNELMHDIQRKGIFKYWFQKRFFKVENEGTILTDIVEYIPPFGKLGEFLNWLIINRIIKKMFHFRQLKTKEILEN